ncbi:MAG: nucleotidyltransferase domain-containing protein [Planctomycetaceae bacterium]|jgi:predicted nucleotidyltransferase|nr:nucleotidyltransferase domain-containing protein [Planctomycetaceae bacterium]
MVIDEQTLNERIEDYVADVRRDMPIDCVYLFGSYANGTPSEWSDIDLCFFSSDTASQRTVDMTVRLLELACKYNPEVCFEPHCFHTSEPENDNPFVKEVLRTGRKISL